MDGRQIAVIRGNRRRTSETTGGVATPALRRTLVRTERLSASMRGA
jgi:hypothetical protein